MTKNWIVKSRNISSITRNSDYSKFDKYEDAETYAKRSASDKGDTDVGIYELIAVARAPVPAIEITKVT